MGSKQEPTFALVTHRGMARRSSGQQEPVSIMSEISDKKCPDTKVRKIKATTPLHCLGRGLQLLVREGGGPRWNCGHSLAGGRAVSV